MGNVGGGEILVILLAALIFLGPEKLPEVARQIGKVLGEVRKVSSGFQREVHDAMRMVDDEINAAERQRPTPPAVPAALETGPGLAEAAPAPVTGPGPQAASSAEPAPTSLPEATPAASSPEPTVPEPTVSEPSAAPPPAVASAEPPLVDQSAPPLGEPPAAPSTASPTEPARAEPSATSPLPLPADLAYGGDR